MSTSASSTTLKIVDDTPYLHDESVWPLSTRDGCKLRQPRLEVSSAYRWLRTTRIPGIGNPDFCLARLMVLHHEARLSTLEYCCAKAQASRIPARCHAQPPKCPLRQVRVHLSPYQRWSTTPAAAPLYRVRVISGSSYIDVLPPTQFILPP